LVQTPLLKIYSQKWNFEHACWRLEAICWKNCTSYPQSFQTTTLLLTAEAVKQTTVKLFTGDHTDAQLPDCYVRNSYNIPAISSWSSGQKQTYGSHADKKNLTTWNNIWRKCKNSARTTSILCSCMKVSHAHRVTPNFLSGCLSAGRTEQTWRRGPWRKTTSYERDLSWRWADATARWARLC